MLMSRIEGIEFATPRTPFHVQRRALGFRQVQILKLVDEAVSEGKPVPSYLVIMRELGIATPGQVARSVKRLEDRGELKRAGSGRERRIRRNGLGRSS